MASGRFTASFIYKYVYFSLDGFIIFEMVAEKFDKKGK